MVNSSELLGLDRQDADLKFIRENVILKSEKTEQDALVMCMQYAKRFGQTGADIARRYGLCAHTLTDIAGGKVIRRGRETILRALVRMFNDLRLKAAGKGNMTLVMELQQVIANITLVSSGIATDAEMVERKRQELEAKWKEKAYKEGVLARSR